MDNMDKNSREMTQAEGSISSSMNPSGMRPLSISTIAMCQILHLGIIDAILNNVDIDYKNVDELIKFLWLHCEDEKKVAHYVSNYRLHPEWLEQEVLRWGMSVDIGTLDMFINDAERDKDNINNAKSQVIPDKGSKKRKNLPSQV